jgi:hypothetical protein
LNLLSFEEEEGDADLPTTKAKIKSSHDLLEDERLMKEAAVSKDELKARPTASSTSTSKTSQASAASKRSAREMSDDEGGNSGDESDSYDRRKREEVLKKRKLAAEKAQGAK